MTQNVLINTETEMQPFPLFVSYLRYTWIGVTVTLPTPWGRASGAAERDIADSR